MDSDKTYKIINTKTGETRSYSLPIDDEISKIRSLVFSIDCFMRSVIHKENRENKISEEVYLRKLRNFQYIDSIYTRIDILKILNNELISVIDDTIRDHEDNEGFPVPITSSLKLLLIYKQCLDTIYNIMENISRFNLFYLCNGMKHSFYDQYKKIIQGNYLIPDEYRDIIKNDMDWYQDVNLIRSNMNHFLIGEYDIEKTENGEWIFKYQNINLSSREPHIDTSQFIERDILEDIDLFYKSLFHVLEKIFLVYLNKTGMETKAHFLKYTADGINIHEMSFIEYVGQEKGTIVEKLD